MRKKEKSRKKEKKERKSKGKKERKKEIEFQQSLINKGLNISADMLFD